MPISPARAAAFEILLRVDATNAYASELLHSERFAKLSSADHGLLTEMVMGVLRWRSVLDQQIERYSSKSLGTFDREVLIALRLGAYQLLFLDRVPDHAAINEGVELVKRARKRSAAGVVNAVLRKMSQEQTAFPHPARTPQGSAPSDIEFSHPKWMVERWQQIYGQETTRKICEYDQSPPRAVIRCPTEFPESFSRSDSFPTLTIPGKLVTKAAIVNSGDITRSPEFRKRRLIIQDEASQLVALLVGNGKSILDCCAAPGGKTRILAERNPEAQIIAMELHLHRAKLLRRLVRDANVRVTVGDARRMPFSIKFDRILVDAPCSGTGTLARNPEIKWRLNLTDLARLQEYQLQILRGAMKQVAPGGRIVYSTCSLELEENSDVIDRALADDDSFRILDCRDLLEGLEQQNELAWPDLSSLLNGPFLRTIPGVHLCDGFFAAVLKKF